MKTARLLGLLLVTFMTAFGQFKETPKKLPVSQATDKPKVDKIIYSSPGTHLLSWKSSEADKPSVLNWEGKKMIIDDKRGTVSWIQGKELTDLKAAPKDKASAVFVSYAFAEKNKNLFKLQNPRQELDVEKIQTDEQGYTHVKMHQYFQGIPVWASQVFFHYNEKGDLYCVNGTYFPTPGFQKIKYSVTPQQAVQQTIQHVSSLTVYRSLTPEEQQILEYSGPVTEKVIYPHKGKFYLAWHITIRPNFYDRYEYFVDATTGKVIDYYNNTTYGDVTATATDLQGQSRTLHVYQSGATYYMIDASRPMFQSSTASQIPNLDKVKGVLATLIAQNANKDIYHITSTNNSWTDARGVSAHYNAGLCYDYFRTKFNRNAIDGQGGNIISIINVMDPQTGQEMDNAFWNGKFMAYGNGKMLFTMPIAAALDVSGHEMTHGVIEKTANLIYRDQSGALNESIADFFGCMIEGGDWRIGEAVASLTYFPSGAMRDMANPHNGANPGDYAWQPAHMNEFVNTTDDNGGVHINSGIHNKALSLLADAITRAKAERIVYKALTTYLTRSSNFIDSRNAMIQAATDIYGANSNEVNNVKQAYDAVGITSGQGGGGGGDIPGISGSEWGLVHAVNADPQALYLVDMNALQQNSSNAFTAISSTRAIRPPYVSDDGGQAVFVNRTNNQIHIINMDAQNPNEQYFPNLGNYWQNVIISPDGTKLLMTSIYNDTSLYLFDMQASKLYKFKLYQPTYSGTGMEAQIIPDMMVWHPNGEYVFFDKEIRITGGSQPINFWDIGIIKVWDKKTNSVGDGSIINLFSSLPDGVSIGNPSLATNSPHIVTFDFYDANSQSYFIYAVNSETGQAKIVFSNSTLGFPDYSNDDKYIVFTALNTNGDTISAKIGMANDKINPSEPAEALLQGARWIRVFAKGQRLVKVEQIHKQLNVSLFPNPTSNTLTLELNLKSPSFVAYEIYNITGQKLLTNRIERFLGETLEIKEVESLAPGNYFLRVTTKEGSETLSFIKD